MALFQTIIWKNSIALDRKKIIPVFDTTFAVVKRKPEKKKKKKKKKKKNQACTGFEPMTRLCDTGAALYQLS